MKKNFIFNQLFHLNEIYYKTYSRRFVDDKNSLIDSVIEHYIFLRNYFRTEILDKDLINNLEAIVGNPKIIRDHDENLTDLAKKLDDLLQENENYFDTSSDLIDFIESIKEIEDKKFSVFLLRHIVIFLLSHCRHLLFREFERQNISHRDIEKIIIENQHKDSFYYNRKSIFLLLYFAIYLLDNNKINKNEVENILEINVDFLKENFPHQVGEYNFFPDIDEAIKFGAYEDAAESISHCYQALEDDGLYSEEEMVEKTDELRGKIMLTIIHYFELSTY